MNQEQFIGMVLAISALLCGVGFKYEATRKMKEVKSNKEEQNNERER